jgi:hypothetical protein
MRKYSYKVSSIGDHKYIDYDGHIGIDPCSFIGTWDEAICEYDRRKALCGDLNGKLVVVECEELGRPKGEACQQST